MEINIFKKPDDLVKFMEKFENSELTYLYLEYDNFKLKLDKRANAPASDESRSVVGANAAAEAAATDSNSNYEYVTAPLVGIFYGKSQGAEIAPIGTAVKKGQPVCAIEAMKMMNDIVAPCDGVIKEILAVDGKMVEFGQKLVAIEKK